MFLPLRIKSCCAELFETVTNGFNLCCALRQWQKCTPGLTNYLAQKHRQAEQEWTVPGLSPLHMLFLRNKKPRLASLPKEKNTCFTCNSHPLLYIGLKYNSTSERTKLKLTRWYFCKSTTMKKKRQI